MTYIFVNWLKCLRNGENIREMTQICWEMAQICGQMTYLFDKILKNVENDLEKWLKYLEMAQMHARLKYLRNGLTILWFKNFGNGLKNLTKMAKICGK